MSSMTPLRRALLAGWLILGAGMIFAILTSAVGWPLAAGVVSLTASIGVVAYTIATWGSDKAAREQTFLDTYGSVEGARATLDVDAVRAVRDRDGLIPAVRLVRHQHPAIPLAQAAEIVKSL